MFDFLIQFLAMVLLLVGLWEIGNEKLRGPFLGFTSNIFTMILGVTHHLWSFLVIGILVFVIQGRNFFKWKKEGVQW